MPSLNCGDVPSRCQWSHDDGEDGETPIMTNSVMVLVRDNGCNQIMNNNMYKSDIIFFSFFAALNMVPTIHVVGTLSRSINPAIP